MNGIGIGDLCRRNDAWNVQVAFWAWWRAYAHSLICKAYMQAVLIGSGVNRYRLDVHFLTCTDHAQRNLASVGYQDLLEHNNWVGLNLMRLDQEQRLVVLNRRRIVSQHLHDLTTYLSFYLVEEFHGFNDADHIAFFHLIAYANEWWLFG